MTDTAPQEALAAEVQDFIAKWIGKSGFIRPSGDRHAESAMQREAGGLLQDLRDAGYVLTRAEDEGSLRTAAKNLLDLWDSTAGSYSDHETGTAIANLRRALAASQPVEPRHG